MTNFVILAPRTAGLPKALPAPPIAPARQATLAGGEGRAKELYAVVASPSTALTRGMPAQFDIQATHRRDSRERQDSSPFTAQRLAQETDPDSGAGSLLPTAIAAYLRARDSRIEILSSVQALDIRV